MVKADQAAARIEAWKGIFDDVMKDAPWAPVFNEKRFTYHSARLGGDPALFTDPIHIPVNYDYIYAKDASKRSTALPRIMRGRACIRFCPQGARDEHPA